MGDPAKSVADLAEPLVRSSGESNDRDLAEPANAVGKKDVAAKTAT